MGTNSVPDDGQYHLIQNGEIVMSTRSKAKASARYKQLRDELSSDEVPAEKPDPAELLRRMKAESEINAMMRASAAAKRTNATYKRGTAARWKST
jgi:hypothetical protein